MACMNTEKKTLLATVFVWHLLVVAATCKGTGNKGCANVQDPQGWEGRQGGHWRQDRGASACHRHSQVRLIRRQTKWPES